MGRGKERGKVEDEGVGKISVPGEGNGEGSRKSLIHLIREECTPRTKLSWFPSLVKVTAHIYLQAPDNINLSNSVTSLEQEKTFSRLHCL